MTIQAAASALLSQMHAPKGAVNVLPVNDEAGQRLVVWIDATLAQHFGGMPAYFEGFPVSIETRPSAIAFAR
jgi:hypothetical protein